MNQLDAQIAYDAVQTATVKIERLLETMPPDSKQKREWRARLEPLYAIRRELNLLLGLPR